MTDPEPCTNCLGAPVTVQGGQMKLCSCCFLGDDGPRVDLVRELHREISRLQEEVATAARENTLLMHQLATLCHPVDRPRVLAALGATIGIPASALAAGAVWTLINAAAVLVMDRSAWLATEAGKGEECPPDCPCPAAVLERALAVVYPVRNTKR